jgi:hypothetical protein
MDYRILNQICCFLPTPEKLLSSSKNFTLERFRNIRWKNRIYFKDNRIKLVNFEDPSYFFQKCKEFWYKNGKSHRDDIDLDTGLTLPAEIWENGPKFWYKDGEKHHVDIDPDTGLIFPAIIYSNGTKYWYKDGEKHRDDIDPDTGLTLPAIIWGDGSKFFFKDGIEFFHNKK